MYQAELRGKLSRSIEAKEDVLTSNVFSFLKYSDRRIFLKQFLSNSVGLVLSDEELSHAEFSFWTRFSDDTEPDVVITTDKHYILIEAKYGGDTVAGISLSQIHGEITQGLLAADNEELSFHYLLISKHYSKPSAELSTSEHSDIICWVNWQMFCGILEDFLSRDSTTKDSLMAKDLYRLLLRKNLRCYRGFSIMPKLAVDKYPTGVFFDSKSSQYRGRFLGFTMDNLSEGNIEKTDDRVFYSRARRYWQSHVFASMKEHKGTVFFRRNKNE